MNNYLPDVVVRQRNLIFNAESHAAKYKLIQELLISLKMNNLTSSIYCVLQSFFEHENRQIYADTEQSIEWVRNKFLRLKQSKWKDHSIIKNDFDLAESIIFCQPPFMSLDANAKAFEDFFHRYCKLMCSNSYPIAGFVGLSISILVGIAQKIAEFGEVELFEGWAELETVEKAIDLNNSFPGIALNAGLSLSEISQIFGYGFISYNFNQSNHEKQIFKFKQCRLIQLIHPNCIEKVLYSFSSKALSDWKVSKDTDINTLYRFLKLVSEYDSLNMLSVFAAASEWQQYDLQIAHNAMKNFFLECSSENSKTHPMTADQINQCIDAFLNMLEIKIIDSKKKAPKSQNKQQARNFVEEIISKYLCEYRPGKGNLKTHDEMHQDIIRIAQQRGSDFLDQLTPAFVKSIYCQQKKIKNIVTKGGRPSKKKPSISAAS